MKNLLVIAMLLASVSAIANDQKAADKDAHKMATEACKDHKDKKAHESCMAAHTKAAPATEMAAPAPAAAPKK